VVEYRGNLNYKKFNSKFKISKNKNYYLKVLADLRKMVKQHNLPARIVEKALFEKNKN
jgi:hypothetical protein